jgi:hypothetical protein
VDRWRNMVGINDRGLKDPFTRGLRALTGGGDPESQAPCGPPDGWRFMVVTQPLMALVLVLCPGPARLK